MTKSLLKVLIVKILSELPTIQLINSHKFKGRRKYHSPQRLSFYGLRYLPKFLQFNNDLLHIHSAQKTLNAFKIEFVLNFFYQVYP